MKYPFSQEKLPLRIHVDPADPNVLLLNAFRGVEAVSRLYEFRLDLASQSKTLKFDDLLGKRVKVEMELAPGKIRLFHGILTKVARGPRDHDFTHFQAVLRPEIWKLSMARKDCVFQEKTVVQILQDILHGHFVDFTSYLQHDEFEPHNYRVLYHESWLNFAARLMEEEGICYFFEHRQDREWMVLANTQIGIMHPPLEDPDVLVFDEEHTAHLEGPRISAWHRGQNLVTRFELLGDYHFQFPKRFSFDASIRQSVAINGSDWKLVIPPINDTTFSEEYPGGYAKRFDERNQQGGLKGEEELLKVPTEGKRLAQIITERETCQSLTLGGTSDYGHLAAGHRFQLTGHFQDSDFYLLTQVDHHCSQGVGRALQTSVLNYSNQFTCVPARIRYRPSDTSLLKPTARTQTAIVIGPDGLEIFTDCYGRVKVQFHWGETNQNLSCWLRVAQPWAGNGWGHLWIPRIGQEVLVDFLEGDPDQPIIVGSVCNKFNPPPYVGEAENAIEASGKATQNGIRSRSTPGGGPENYNEIRFEDRKDQEVLGIHAERDLHTSVERNENHSVGVDQRITIGNNRFISVGGTLKDGTRHGDERTMIMKDHHSAVFGESRTNVKGTLNAGFSDDAIYEYRKNLKISVAKALTISAETISLNAGEQITLTVGSGSATSYIVIDASGVTVVGAPQISLNPPGGPSPSITKIAPVEDPLPPE